MVKNWFQHLSKERKKDVLAELDQTSSPGFDFFLMVVLSCSIATFGLITNSPAVIIGAMLVAPLMSPILGLSLATVAAKERMFERSTLALVEGVGLALLISTILAFIALKLPFDLLVELPSEVLSRIHPNPLDLGIALAGGAAAAYALAQPKLSATLPGVAIATALMPPLCTAGIGIATGNWSTVVVGGMILFVTNLCAISFAGIVVFIAMGFRPLNYELRWHNLPRSLLISAGLVLVVSVPLVYLTMQVVNQAHNNKYIHQTVTDVIEQLPDAQVIDVKTDGTDSILKLSVTVLTTNPPNYARVLEFQKEIASRLDRVVSLYLVIVPGISLDPMKPPTKTLTPTLTGTARPTVTLTATLTPTPSPTRTVTPTPTPTPILAQVYNTNGKGIYLFDEPEQNVVGSLASGTPVYFLYQRMIVNHYEWVKIRGPNGLTGWVPINFIVFYP